MKLTIELNGKSFTVDLGKPLDISIPVTFGKPQLNVFDTPAASSHSLCSVTDGAGVNCETYTITPHCNGTHTECVGHIAKERIAVHDILKDAFIPATLITVTPQRGIDSGESYDPPFGEEDVCVTCDSLKKVLGVQKNFLDALIIRTLPNGDDKKTRDYDQNPPPFFSKEAMEFIAALGVKHVLVDFPSVDRLHDEGKLANHHTFWGVPQGSHDIDPSAASLKTITELVYVPESVKDGRYLLNLQIAPFQADAAPSRPVLFAIQ